MYITEQKNGGVKVLLVLNLLFFIATGVILAVFNGRILNLEKGGDVQKNANTAVLAVPEEESLSPKRMATKSVSMTDAGFSPSGLQMYTKEIMKLSVKNDGKKAHSFVIDELKIDSGMIKPGQSKEVTIDIAAGSPSVYVFYSNAADDSKDSFKGVIMVLE